MNDKKPLLTGLLSALLASQAGAANYTFTTLDVPGAWFTFLTDINDSGQITGHYYNNDGSQVGFVKNGGTFTQGNRIKQQLEFPVISVYRHRRSRLIGVDF